jgi:hypothetical protein
MYCLSFQTVVYMLFLLRFSSTMLGCLGAPLRFIPFLLCRHLNTTLATCANDDIGKLSVHGSASPIGTWASWPLHMSKASHCLQPNPAQPYCIGSVHDTPKGCNARCSYKKTLHTHNEDGQLSHMHNCACIQRSHRIRQCGVEHYLGMAWQHLQCRELLPHLHTDAHSVLPAHRAWRNCCDDLTHECCRSCWTLVHPPPPPPFLHRWKCGSVATWFLLPKHMLVFCGVYAPPPGLFFSTTHHPGLDLSSTKNTCTWHIHWWAHCLLYIVHIPVTRVANFHSKTHSSVPVRLVQEACRVPWHPAVQLPCWPTRNRVHHG